MGEKNLANKNIYNRNWDDNDAVDDVDSDSDSENSSNSRAAKFLFRFHFGESNRKFTECQIIC